MRVIGSIRMSASPTAASGAAVTRVQDADEPLHDGLDRRIVEQVGGVADRTPPRLTREPGLDDDDQIQLRGMFGGRTGSTVRPATVMSASATAAVGSNDSITCASGEKPPTVPDFSASTTVSKGASAWAKASRSTPHLLEQFGEPAGGIDLGAQDEGVDEHADQRVEHGLTRARRSVWPLRCRWYTERAISTANAACTTMNGVAPRSLATELIRSPTSAGIANSTRPPAIDATDGRGRVGSSRTSGRPASWPRQYSS